jgi:hypothetical protein
LVAGGDTSSYAARAMEMWKWCIDSAPLCKAYSKIKNKWTGSKL